MSQSTVTSGNDKSTYLSRKLVECGEFLELHRGLVDVGVEAVDEADKLHHGGGGSDPGERCLVALRIVPYDRTTEICLGLLRTGIGGGKIDLDKGGDGRFFIVVCNGAVEIGGGEAEESFRCDGVFAENIV